MEFILDLNGPKLLYAVEERHSDVSVRLLCSNRLEGEDLQHNKKMTTKWGIVSVGMISNDFVTSLSAVKNGNHIIVAVAASEKSKARKFADRFGIKIAYGTYDALATDENVEIVYVGTVHSVHYSIVKTMLEHGKHVLCEVPLCINSIQTKELISLAKRKTLFLMEAMISRCTPAYDALKRHLESGAIGSVRHVMVHFGINVWDENGPRGDRKSGGGLLCFGFHMIQLAMFAFNEQHPSAAYIAGSVNEKGFDDFGSCNLKFGDKQLATLVYSTVNKLPNDAYIIGTKGCIKIHEPFWIPDRISVNGVQLNTELLNNDQKYIYPNSSLLNYEAESARSCLLNGLTECPQYSLSTSHFVAELVDELRTQLGIRYR